MNMKVVVGSKNQSKLTAVKTVFEYFFNPIEVVGLSVSSMVSDQPASLDEMYQGALTRAQASLHVANDADYGVGIEGGVTNDSFGWYKSALVVIVNRNGEIGIGRSGGLVIPESITTEIAKGKNLSDITDTLFGTKDVGKGRGFFGVITNDFINRSSATEHGIAFALSRFLHPNIWK